MPQGPSTPANTAPAARCLIVTEMPLDNLRESRHGIYQRFRMLVEAMSLTGLGLDVVCSQGPLTPADDPQSPGKVAEQLRRHWGIEARVLGLTRMAKDTRTPYLLQQLIGCLSHRWSPGHRAAVAGGQLALLRRALAQGPALVLAHRMNTMSLLMAAPDLPPCVFDMDDVEHIVHQRRMKQARGLRQIALARAAWPALRAQERQAVQRAWRTLVCAKDDARQLADFAQVAPDRVMVVPNGLPLAPPRPALPAEPALLMVGIYSYEPNGDGARHFIEQVWPLIRQARPQAEVWFVGPSPESIGDTARMPAGVKLMGFVDDLEAIYARASVVICPILIGGGTRVKLIEAALRGKAIVSTTLGAEGLGFTDGEHARLSDTPQQFAQACVDLMDSPERAHAMGQQAQAFAEQHYDRARIAQDLAAHSRAMLAERASAQA